MVIIKKAYMYAMEMKLVKEIEYSRFIRRLNRLESQIEQLLQKSEIELSPIHRKNMKCDISHKIKRKIRKGVETAFSVITSKFGKVLKSTSIGGFLTKLKLFLLSYSIDMFFKLSDDHKNLAFN